MLVSRVGHATTSKTKISGKVVSFDGSEGCILKQFLFYFENVAEQTLEGEQETKV